MVKCSPYFDDQPPDFADNLEYDEIKIRYCARRFKDRHTEAFSAHSSSPPNLSIIQFLAEVRLKSPSLHKRGKKEIFRNETRATSEIHTLLLQLKFPSPSYVSDHEES